MCFFSLVQTDLTLRSHRQRHKAQPNSQMALTTIRLLLEMEALRSGQSLFLAREVYTSNGAKFTVACVISQFLG